jgi:L-alanine-DL-glutamate epimerase-like enolase superfamily enzyme
LAADSICQSFSVPLSAHCAPHLHLHPCCSVRQYRHLEYFCDHERIEDMLFDGAMKPVGGTLTPDLSRPGLGLELKKKDAEKYAAR